MAEDIIVQYRAARAPLTKQWRRIPTNKLGIANNANAYNTLAEHRRTLAHQRQCLVVAGTKHAQWRPAERACRVLPAKVGVLSRLGRFATFKHARMLDPDAIKAAQKFRCTREHNCMERVSIDAIA